jgi:glycerol-3-phosphate dehydrogenase (NAD(P)+)
MSNGIREMKKFIRKSTNERALMSAYLGDFIGYGYSFSIECLGNMIGKGYTVKSAMMEMSMVAEG